MKCTNTAQSLPSVDILSDARVGLWTCAMTIVCPAGLPAIRDCCQLMTNSISAFSRWKWELVDIREKWCHFYGVVTKGLLTFLGSLYKEVATTASGTLVYCFEFERQTARKRKRRRKKSSIEKHCVLDLECRILSQEPSDSCILYCNAIFHGK